MKHSLKVVLSLCILGGLIGIYQLDNYFTEKKENEKKLQQFAFHFENNDVTEIDLQSKSETIHFEKSGNNWKLNQNPELPADQNAVQNIVESFANLTYFQKQPFSINKNSLENYGFQSPRLEMTFRKSKKEIVHFLVGNRLDLNGKQGEISQSFYLFDKIGNQIFVVPQSALENIFEKTKIDFFSKNIGIQFNPNLVEGIDIETQGNIFHMEKKGTGWSSIDAPEFSVDENYVSSFLTQYQSLSAEKFILMKESQKDLSLYNLKVPAATIILKDKSKKELQKFIFGLTKDGVYSQVSKNILGQMNLKIWTDLVPKFTQFLNRKLTLGLPMDSIDAIHLSKTLHYLKKGTDWYKSQSKNPQDISPTNKKTETASTFLTSLEYTTAKDLLIHPTQKDLKKFGLLVPQKEFSLDYNEKGNQKSVTFLIGDHVPFDEKNIYAKRADEDFIFIVDTSWLSDLSQLYN